MIATITWNKWRYQPLLNFWQWNTTHHHWNPRTALESRCCQLLLWKKSMKNEYSGNCWFCTKHHLPTGGSEITKYSNNPGYWDADILNKTLLRLAKCTHDATGGYMVVINLQVVSKGGTYHLTDPDFLCKDILRFGNTNLGEKFIKKCIH